ncbi:MAG: M15 family metallopeptidase [Evtepia gabavorous]
MPGQSLASPARRIPAPADPGRERTPGRLPLRRRPGGHAGRLPRRGHAPLLCSSYRTQEKQTQLYNNLVQKQIARGNSRSEAMAKAAKEVAVPGTSEHQLGLAVDIVDTQNQVLNRAQEDTAVQQWLMEHCWEYGFILRYPPDKEEKTGIIYEPWHYRYVGREYAQAIRQSGLCLEEFLQR